jgi:hypothetical protein
MQGVSLVPHRVLRLAGLAIRGRSRRGIRIFIMVVHEKFTRVRRNTAVRSVYLPTGLLCQTLDTVVVGSKLELPGVGGDFPQRGVAGTMQ